MQKILLSLLVLTILFLSNSQCALPANYVYTIDTLTITNKDVHSIVSFQGELYFSQRSLCTIYRYDKTTGKGVIYAGKGACTTKDLTDYGDGGLATNAQFSEFHEMVMDADGNMFISDTAFHVIRMVNFKTKIITKVLGTYSSGFSPDLTPIATAQVSQPKGLRCFNGSVYFVDYLNNRIRKFKPDYSGVLETVGGSGTVSYTGTNGDGGSALKADMGPLWLDVASNGDIYFVDDAIKTVRRISKESGLIHTVASGGSEDYKYKDGMNALDVHIWPGSVTVFNGGNDLLVTSTGILYQFTLQGTLDSKSQPTYASYIIAGTLETRTYQYNGDNMLANEATLDGPTTTLVMSDATILIADTEHQRIRKLLPGDQIKRNNASKTFVSSVGCLILLSFVLLAL